MYLYNAVPLYWAGGDVIYQWDAVHTPLLNSLRLQTHKSTDLPCVNALLLYLHTCVKALVLLCPVVERFNITNTLLA